MSRETALRVLIACRTNGAWADAALQAQIKRAALSRRDAALCSRLVYGVLQNQLLLDFYIGTYCSQRPDHLQPPLQDILRLGAYQILYLEKVPDSAAVNSSVELAKYMKRGQAAGLVNAVLRKLSQNKDRLPTIPDQDEAKYLSIRYSHPKWLVKRLLPILGRTETEVFLACGNTQPQITAQINTCRTTAERTAEALAVEGVRAEAHPWMPACLLLSGTGDLEHVEAFQSGSFYIQDPAARLSVMASGIKPGERMLDVCAAPGGKSFAAAIQMGDRGTVLACDIHQNKLKRIHDGAARLGLQSIETTAVDGRIFRAEWEGQFDLVLVDAPCSGLGIIRKKPDIRYKKLDSLFAMPVIQRAILDNAARYVRPGGTLLYSTCTILPEENEEVSDGFLSEHPEFLMTPFTLPEPIGTCNGRMTLWPHRHQTDGFYICRMTRRP